MGCSRQPLCCDILGAKCKWYLSGLSDAWTLDERPAVVASQNIVGSRAIYNVLPYSIRQIAPLRVSWSDSKDGAVAYEWQIVGPATAQALGLAPARGQIGLN